MMAMKSVIAASMVALIALATPAAAQNLINGAPQTVDARKDDKSLYVAETAGSDTPIFSEFTKLGRAANALYSLELRIAELNFSDWCAFNGFALGSNSVQHMVYPCIRTDDYSAVWINNKVSLFKRDGKRMIKLTHFVDKEEDRYRLVDFTYVAKSFWVEAP